jgi:glucose-6-phosphate 1-dehydrogenase
MELPEDLTTDAIQTKKLDFLQSIPELSKEEVEERVVRGQYGPDNQGKYISYRQEDDVPVDSRTETYIAIEMYIDMPRWEGVPIYVRTGKSLVEGFNSVDIVLTTPENVEEKVPNRLSFGIRPEKGVSFVLNQKLPKNEYKSMATFVGPDHETIDTFYIASPYENLIADALRGDPTYFMTIEQIREQWRITDSIVAAWEDMEEPDFPNYRANTFGPVEAEELLAKNGDEWIHRSTRYL